jgi:hypothetical protein
MSMFAKDTVQGTAAGPLRGRRFGVRVLAAETSPGTGLAARLRRQTRGHAVDEMRHHLQLSADMRPPVSRFARSDVS